MGSIKISNFEYKAVNKKHSNQVFLKGLAVALVLFAIGLYGFGLSRVDTIPNSRSGSITEKQWYGKWNVTIANATGGRVTKTFDLSKQEEGQLHGSVFEDQDKAGRLYRMKPATGDFRGITGTIELPDPDHAWTIELTLLSNKECFTGVIRKTNTKEKMLCYGEKQ